MSQHVWLHCMVCVLAWDGPTSYLTTKSKLEKKIIQTMSRRTLQWRLEIYRIVNIVIAWQRVPEQYRVEDAVGLTSQLTTAAARKPPSSVGSGSCHRPDAEN